MNNRTHATYARRHNWRFEIFSAKQNPLDQSSAFFRLHFCFGEVAAEKRAKKIRVTFGFGDVIYLNGFHKMLGEKTPTKTERSGRGDRGGVAEGYRCTD